MPGRRSAKPHESFLGDCGHSSFLSFWFAYVHRRAGHKSEAQKFLHKIEAERSRRYVDASKLVMANLGVGDNEQALKWFEKGFSERSTALVWLKVDPVYDPLRSEPRFHELLTRVGFQ